MYSGDSVHVWHVAKSGNDGNGGHAQQYPIDLAADAKLTVQAAINAAAAGDTIIGHPGAYTEDVALNKSLTLEGVHRDQFRIESSTGDALTISAGNCTIRSLTAKTTQAISQGINCTGAISGLKFFDVAGEGPYDGINLGNASNVWLEECVFTSPFDTMQLGGGANIIALRCIIVNTGGASISTGIIFSGKAGRIIDCTVKETSSTSNTTLNGIKISGSDSSAVISGCDVSVKHSAEGGSEETIALSVSTLSNVKVFGSLLRAGGLAGTTRIVKVAAKSEVSLDNVQVNYMPWASSIYSDVTAQVEGFEKTKFIDTGMTPLPDDTYNDWWIQWRTGNNAGVFSQVDDWTLIPKEFVLKAATPYDIEVGDKYVIFPKKSSTTTSLYNDDSALRVVNSHYDPVNTVGTISQGGAGWAAAVKAENDTAISDAFTFTGANVHSDAQKVVGNTPMTGTNVTERAAAALAAINLDHFIQVAGTVSDVSPAASEFDTSLTEATDNHYSPELACCFTSGNLAGQARRISAYDGTAKAITVSPAYTEAPANGDAFVIIPASLDITSVLDILQADAVINTAGSPWTLQIKHKVSGAVLVEKELRDKDGNPITAVSTVVGQQVEIP